MVDGNRTLRLELLIKEQIRFEGVKMIMMKGVGMKDRRRYQVSQKQCKVKCLGNVMMLESFKWVSISYDVCI